MDILNVLKVLLTHWFDLDVMEFVGVFDVFIETASSRASSWISWCLSLSFYTFDNFTCFLVYSAKWVNSVAVFRAVVHNSVGHLSSLLAWHTYLIWLANEHLVSWSMGHILFIDLRGNIHIVMISHDYLVVKLMLANVS